MSGKIEAVVYTPDHVVVPDKNGKPNLHRIYRDASGKQVISPNPNPVATARWQLHQERFRGTGTINAPVMSARTGAMSAGTVTATVIDHRGKREVMQEVLEKARTGGKALGKGAATVGRAAASRTPYGIAFMLALEALGGSKFFWDDEKGDFVRYDNDNLYVVLSTKKASSSFPSPLDDKTLKEFCSKNDCQKVAVIEGKAAADKAAKEFCQSRTYNNSSGQTNNFDSIGWSGYCYDSKKNTLGSIGVKVIRWVDTVPITLDEFIDESTPEEAEKPNEWVETADVKPTGEPEVEVPAGTVAQTDPYTDPKDGKVKQTRWDFEGKDRVRETTIERPDLTPGSPEAPELKPPVEEPQDPNNGDKDKDKDGKDGEEEKDKEPPEQFDLCKEHPDILACQKMGEVEEGFFDDIKIPEITDERTWEEDRFLPSNGTCPAPKTFHVWGKPIQLSYEPLCRFMEMVRFIILVAFILMSAFLVFGSLRKE